MRKPTPINIIVQFPATEAGRGELLHRAAEVHADAVLKQIKQLTCPNSQKLHLLDAVIREAKTACSQTYTQDSANHCVCSEPVLPSE